MVALSSASLSALSCHCRLIRVEAIPMTNRSYASVKKPIPETSTARK